MTPPAEDDHGDQSTLLVVTNTDSQIQKKRSFGLFSSFRRGASAEERAPLTTAKNETSAICDTDSHKIGSDEESSSKSDDHSSSSSSDLLSLSSNEASSESDGSSIGSEEENDEDDPSAAKKESKDLIDLQEPTKREKTKENQSGSTTEQSKEVRQEATPRFWRFRRSSSNNKEQKQSLLEHCHDDTQQEEKSITLEGFGSEPPQPHNRHKSLLPPLGRLISRKSNNNNDASLSEQDMTEMEQKFLAAESGKLRQMKVKTEETKHEKDWKEKTSITFAKVLTPELYAQENLDGEGNLGQYRTVRMEQGDDEGDDENLSETERLEHQIKKLESQVQELQAQLMIKDFEAMGWKKRAKELEREVKRQRRKNGSSSENSSSDDDSSGSEQEEINNTEPQEKEGKLLDLSGIEDNTKSVSTGDPLKGLDIVPDVEILKKDKDASVENKAVIDMLLNEDQSDSVEADAGEAIDQNQSAATGAKEDLDSNTNHAEKLLETEDSSTICAVTNRETGRNEEVRVSGQQDELDCETHPSEPVVDTEESAFRVS